MNLKCGRSGNLQPQHPIDRGRVSSPFQQATCVGGIDHGPKGTKTGKCCDLVCQSLATVACCPARFPSAQYVPRKQLPWSLSSKSPWQFVCLPTICFRSTNNCLRFIPCYHDCHSRLTLDRTTRPSSEEPAKHLSSAAVCAV
jgi:hypothetical protein